MKNLRERMAVLYGELAEVEFVSRPGRGTKVRLLMPIVNDEAAAWEKSGQAMIDAAGQLLEGAVRAVTRGDG